MARECPTKKRQPYKPTTGKENRQYSGYKPRFQPYRRKNQGSPPNFQKSNRFQPCQSHVRIVNEEPDEENNDLPMFIPEEADEEPNIGTIAARTACFSKDEKRERIAEMQKLGINFQ